MELMGLNPQSVEAIVLSHELGDPTDGLRHLFLKGIKPTIFVI
jgi:metal-dependent hydrolase (beta-lactamase superfamily II)